MGSYVAFWIAESNEQQWNAPQHRGGREHDYLMRQRGLGESAHGIIKQRSYARTRRVHATPTNSMPLNKFSRIYTQDDSLPASQAMLIGAAACRTRICASRSWASAPRASRATPATCTSTALADEVKRGVAAQGLVGLRFNTIGVSDGITNGNAGMRYSLVSREIIADSIEAMAGAHYYDALATWWAATRICPARSSRWRGSTGPSLMVYGGTIRGGEFKGQQLNIVSCFRGVWQEGERADFGGRLPGHYPQRLPRRRARAAACTRPTRWRRPSKRWA
ncbi:MAG: dihydroxy-acid dehydratase [Hymenobacter sp.]